MKSVRFLEFNIMLYILQVICLRVSGGKTSRPVNKGREPIRLPEFLPGGEQSRGDFDRNLKSAWSDKQRFGSLIGTDGKHKNCKDCNEGDQKRKSAPREGSTPGSIQPPQSSIRVRVFQDKKGFVSKSERREPDGHSQLPRKFRNLLDRRIRELERQHTRLANRLRWAQSKHGKSDGSRHLAVRSMDLRTVKSAKYMDQPSTNWPKTVGKEKRILLKLINGKSKTYQYISMEPGSKLEERGSYMSSELVKNKGPKYSNAKTFPQDHASGITANRADVSTWHSHADGLMFGGNRLVRPIMADRLESSVTSLLPIVQKLRRHASAMMKAFISSEQQFNRYHQEILNSTRYKILPGVRDALEVIHEANEHILDGKNIAYQVTLRASFKRHLSKDTQRKGLLQEDTEYPGGQEAEALRMVDEIRLRNFTDKLEMMMNEEDEIHLFEASIPALQSECSQRKVEVNRVRSLFEDRDYFLTLRGLREYLNDATRTLNRNFLDRPAFRKPMYQKRLLDSAYEHLEHGEDMVRISYNALRSSMSSQKENWRLVEKWLARKRGSEPTPRRNMESNSPREMELLSMRVRSSGIHSRQLKDRAERDLRDLTVVMKEAKKFLSQPHREGAVRAQLLTLTENLQKFIPDMYGALEDIGNLTGSNVNLTRPNRFLPAETYEGSGDDGETDGAGVEERDENMAEAGSGDGEERDNSSNKSNSRGFFGWFISSTDDDSTGTNGHDFTFEEEEPVAVLVDGVKELKSLSRTQNVSALNRSIRAFTAALLKASQELFVRAQALNTSLKALQQNWGEMKEDVIGIERTINAHKALKKKLEEMAKDTMSVTSRIEHLKNLPSMLQLNNVRRIAKWVEDNYVAVATGKREPMWQEDYYKFYEDEFYYVDYEKLESPEQEQEQRDAAAADYEELYEKGRRIDVARKDIRRLRYTAVDSCNRVGAQLGSVHGNLSALRHKVLQTRDMLGAMQLSVLKRGKGHITIPIKPNLNEQIYTRTSMGLCIKPKTLDGTVLLVRGNNSASYRMSLSEGVLTASVYDTDWNKLDEIKMDKTLKKDIWHAIQIQRNGLYLTVSVQQQGREKETKSEQVDVNILDSIKSEPAIAYLGGAPAKIKAVSESWEGCIADLSINGRVFTLFTSDSARQGASLCDNHCVARGETLSTIFNGNGFLHFSGQVVDSTLSIAFAFTTHQQSASLISIVNNTERFYLHVMLENGALRVQRSSEQKSVLYLSSNKEYGNGKSHKVKVEFKDSATHIIVDETKDDFQVRSSKPVTEKQSLQGILIGAFVSIDNQFQHNVSSPLIGCISDVSVNDEKLLLSQTDQVYNIYRGHCVDAKENFWHACRQWNEESSSVVLKDIPLSKTVSLWVSANASGPVLRYVRQGIGGNEGFAIDIVTKSEGLLVTINGSPQELSKPKEEEADDFFSIIVMDKPSVSTVEVLVWGQSIDYVYSRSWYWIVQSSDPDQSHSLIIAGLGQSGDYEGHESGNFTGSLSQLMIENRFIDLSHFKISHNINACQRPLTEVPPRDVNDVPPQVSRS